jgi:hypothetical protein
MTTKHLAALAGAVAVAAGIGGAPVASADPNQPQQTCETPGANSTICQSPGDVEVKNAPPPVTFYPYGSPPPTAG